MAMSIAGLGIKYGFAGEDQQQFPKTEVLMEE
jgi:hypothetical protein